MTPLPLTLLRPSTWKPSFDAARSLWFDYAHLRSTLHHACVDAAGHPVPWYTYPAIEYLKQLDFTGKTVFEYGSGNSTLFWANAAARVVSVEDDEGWYATISQKIPAHCQLILETDLAAYVDVIDRFEEPFDVIVVDGAARGRTRLKCSKAAVRHLRPGGLIILDNSDWLPESARFLRQQDFIEVDMAGFAPISGRTQTTSLFFHRQFAVRPRHDRHPQPGPGAADKNWERMTAANGTTAECGGEVFGGVTGDEELTFITAGGDRRFRLVFSTATDGRRWVAIFDLDRDRVVLGVCEGEDPRHSVEQEVAGVASMTWDEFRAFIQNHPRRRYVL